MSYLDKLRIALVKCEEIALLIQDISQMPDAEFSNLKRRIPALQEELTLLLMQEEQRHTYIKKCVGPILPSTFEDLIMEINKR